MTTALVQWQGDPILKAMIPVAGQKAGIVAELCRRLWCLAEGDRFCLARVPTDTATREILRDTDSLIGGETYELMAIGTAV
jgi:hypothetical protein